jgi:hypothetical protein
MDDFEEWYDWTDWNMAQHNRGFKGCIRKAYEAGKQSQQNRITELEEIISGREELQRGGVGY